ncbi:ATP-binding cassette domain-containing protein, partial [Gluconacetobacter sacchari]
HQITSIPTRDTGSEGPCEISGLAVSYGQSVLIEGENGAGKTTLANIISGHFSTFGGKIRRPKK